MNIILIIIITKYWFCIFVKLHKNKIKNKVLKFGNTAASWGSGVINMMYWDSDIVVMSWNSGHVGESDGRRNPTSISHNLQYKQLVTHLESKFFVYTWLYFRLYSTVLLLGFDVWLRHPVPYNQLHVDSEDELLFRLEVISHVYLFDRNKSWIDSICARVVASNHDLIWRLSKKSMIWFESIWFDLNLPNPELS